MTFTHTPANYSSVNDELVYTVYDANSIDVTKTDYKYVGEVWVDGVKVHTERAYPRPAGAFGVFEFSEIVRNYITPDFAPGAGVTAFLYGAEKFRTKDVVIKIREEYNGTVGAVVLTDSARTFYNHYNDRPDGLTAISAFANKVASDRPKTITLTLECNYYFVPYFKTTAGNITATIAGQVFTVTTTEANSCAMINISPGAVNAAVPGTITAATDSYTAVIDGVTYTVNVVCKGWYTNYVAHFLNKYGAFESMLFNKPRRRSLTIDRKSFKQSASRIDSGTGAVSYGVGSIRYEQRVNYATKVNEKLRIQTDLLSDGEYAWLSQLAVSPFVYLEDAGTFYPVVLTGTDYNFNEYIVDRLTTLQLDVEFATHKNTQFR